MNENIIIAAVFVALGLNIATQVVVLLIANIFGGFKFGSLAKSIELKLSADKLDAFTQLFRERTQELGFVRNEYPENNETIFTQGGKTAGLAGTHAKTKKELRLRIEEESPETYKTTISLKYTDPILADTGESSYRDGVLDYVSGREREMICVTSVSHAGDCCFTGSLIALVVVLVNYIVANSQMLHWAAAFFCLTSIVLGIQAFIVIMLNPQGLTGLYRTLFGIFLNAGLIALSVALLM